MNIGRNDQCPCGSGKKYKKCCQNILAERMGAPTAQTEISKPSPTEIKQLVSQFNSGRYVDLENQSRELLKRYPASGFVWKALGASLKAQGKIALFELQKAAELEPDDVEAHNNLGNALKDLGRLDDAMASYHQALKLKPDLAEAHYNLGNALKDLGRLDDAVASYRRAIEFKPDFAEAHSNLGIALQDLGRLDSAVASYHQALKLKSDYAEAYNNLGNALKGLGRLDDAASSYYQALKIKPDFAEAHSNLGNALKDLGRLDDAVASCRLALKYKPDFAEAYNSLGNALKNLGRLNEAVESYNQSIQLKPDYAEAHSNLGMALQDLGKIDEALASYHRAINFKPYYAEAHSNLGMALQELGRLDEAVANCHLAIKFKMDLAEAHNNLGIALKDLGRFDDAVASYKRALKFKPDLAEAHSNLGIALKDIRRLDEAVVSLCRAIKIKPDYAEAHSNLGLALADLGQLDDAVTGFRRALEIKPDYAAAYSNLLFLFGYHTSLDPYEYLSSARGWELACVPAQDREAARHRVLQSKAFSGTRLKVGYVSGDYRQHAVSYFIERLFTHHDRERIELFAYSTQGRRDSVTERLQALAEHWVMLAGISDDAARERIEADGIDVLIDLSGHTQHNRLGVFARRAAPVQVHYLGYFASTGLTEMDYWIGDDILTPASRDDHFSEQVWRLPRVWVSYDGKTEAPVTDWRPDQDGVIWLGSFNNLGKLTPATLGLWAKVLHALPEGKLLLKTKELSDQGNRQRILEAMAGYGIPSERIELRDGSATLDWLTHMAYYDRLDIALDPVGGMGGSTTTCDALWMGVPVITLEGDRVASRMTASMLNALSCPEWIASSEAEYIDKVVVLARDVEGRKVLRPAQRNRMAASPLCDASGLATALENAYFEMAATRSQRKEG